MRLLFLEAKTDTLIKRFSETRRRHPLSGRRASPWPSASRASASCWRDIGEFAHHVDTSDLGPNTLRSWIKDLVEVDRSPA